jgi:23S rRNA G2069 N7-methylase RlmK/C1962 C5-methylase RlmI
MPISTAVRVNRKAAQRLQDGHLWVFASDVIQRAKAEPGDVVKVVDPTGKALGTAHFSSTSQIALRLLSPRLEPIDQNFFLKRFQAALQFRNQVVNNTNAYRLIHAEGDLLPGLIVDRYAEYLVMQFLDQGMDRQAGQVIGALNRLLSPLGIVARNDTPVRAKENLPLETKILFGEIPPSVETEMNGLRLTLIPSMAKKQASSWISAKIMSQWPHTRTVAGRSIASRAAAASRSISPLAASLSRPWIVPRPLSKPLARMLPSID